MRRFPNLAHFMRFSGQLLPWVAWPTALLLAPGLILALFVAPPHYQQGESVRIMFILAPAVWMSMFVYAVVAGASAVALIWRHPLADVAAAEAAPLGAAFTLFFVTVLLVRMRGAIIGRKLRALRHIQVERLERFVAVPREAPGSVR